MKCQNCGTEHNSNFCPNCGTQAEHPPTAVPTATKCPKCGVEYVGNFCPSGCNSLYYKPKKKKIGGIIAAVFVVCLFAFAATMGILYGEEEPSDGPNNSSTESHIEYIEISANELYAAFEANEVAADEKYKGQYVKVTGTVTEISSGGTFTQACILLNVENSIIFGDVQCNFSDDDAAQKIAELTKGQTVTITGLCSGLGTINLDINNCEIVGD